MSPPPTDHNPAWHRFLTMLLIVAAVAFVYWPGVYGFWGRDDYMQLALVRMVGSPWPLFTHDHFAPMPGSVFRPLGFASLWLSTALFGTDYMAQALVDLALHAGVALALFGLMTRAGIPNLLALACTLLFALHPAVLGTALWWSARFDLIATLFILLALNAAFAYRKSGGVIALLLAMIATLAAMLSKEIGLAVLVPVSLLWLHRAWREPAQRTRTVCALVLLWSSAAVYFGWRWAVLGTPTSGLAGEVPLGVAIAKGVVDWLHQMPGYLSFWSRLGAPLRMVVATAAVALVAALIVRSRQRIPRINVRTDVEVLLCGLSLFVLPALLQAPVAALNAAPLSADVSAIEAAMQSRLYYLGIAGIALAIAAVLAPRWRSSSSWRRGAIFIPLACMVLAFAGVAQHGAQAFAQRSIVISAVAREAVAAVRQLPLPATPCHVVFADIDPAPEWGIFVSMDSIVKALSPDLERVRHCVFHANYPTWFHLLDASVDPAAIAPYRALQNNGHIVPWLRLGDLAVAYMRAPLDIEPIDLARMRFLRWRDGHFEDVTDDVAARRLPLQLQ